jgi:hypothetical protein
MWLRNATLAVRDSKKAQRLRIHIIETFTLWILVISFTLCPFYLPGKQPPPLPTPNIHHIEYEKYSRSNSTNSPASGAGTLRLG